jgi:predicted NUDIX family NTP pyrophosphohydrolase
VAGKHSAGLLLHRRRAGRIEVLLVHPGGPFFAKKDAGAWSIPKGELEPGEDALAAARREVQEETGFTAGGPFVPLGTVMQRGGKLVTAFGCAADHDFSRIECNSFELEWPPRSGRRATFPEIDRAEYFSLEVARVKINPAQAPLLERLQSALEA